MTGLFQRPLSSSKSNIASSKSNIGEKLIQKVKQKDIVWVKLFDLKSYMREEVGIYTVNDIELLHEYNTYLWNDNQFTYDCENTYFAVYEKNDLIVFSKGSYEGFESSCNYRLDICKDYHNHSKWQNLKTETMLLLRVRNSIEAFYEENTEDCRQLFRQIAENDMDEITTNISKYVRQVLLQIDAKADDSLIDGIIKDELMQKLKIC